jgi:hypothetical protein
MKTRDLMLVLICLLALKASLRAQSNPPAGTSQGAGTVQAQGSMPLIDPPSKNGSSSPSLDPDQGLDGISWDGKNFKVTDLRIIDSKFSAYLNEPEISYQEEAEYSRLTQQILEKLDVFAIREKGRSLLKEVLPLLAKASRHPRDGGVCRQIYNAVGVDAQSKDAADSKQKRIKEIEKEIDTLKWNMSVAAKPSSMDVRPKAGEAGSYYQYEEAQREKRTRLTFMQNDLENKYAELLATQNSIVSKTDDARLALQRLIVANFLARRFDHVMIATSFYRLLYPDGASEVKLQERVIAEAAENAKRLRSATSFDKTETTSEQIGFGSGGIYSNKTTTRANKEDGITSMLPSATEALGSITAAKIKFASLIPDTMTEVELASQEAIDQCNRYISVVRAHIQNQELDNALERLREAFAFGEQLASVRSFPREGKQSLWKYKNILKEARTGLASKDLGKAKEAIAKVNQMTSDNPLSKEGSDIGNVETISAMHLAKAKEAASRGDRDTMNKELEEAAKAWPQNPALASATAKIIDQIDQQSQNKTELRKLIQQKNYKYIFDEKARFLASASDDEKLLEELNQVLQSYSSSLSYSGKAEEFLKRNDAFGAWETAEEGIKKYPDSTELIKIRSDAAMKVPDFVREIEKGRSSAERQDPVTALCAYLAAKRLYPNSTMAKEGIEKSTAQAITF